MQESLQYQMELLAENKIDFLDTHYPYTLNKSIERKKMDALLSKYTQRIEDVLHSINGKSNYAIDFVAVGCKVTIMYTDDQSEESFMICLPEHSDPELNQISFLSPVGQQLLLASIGETVSIDTPVGQMSVIVKDVQFIQTERLEEKTENVN